MRIAESEGEPNSGLLDVQGQDAEKAHAVAGGGVLLADDIQDAITAVTGYDPITSERQTTFTRVTSGISAIIPFVGGKAVAKAVLAGGAALGIKTLTRANFADNLAKMTGGVVKNAHAHHMLSQKLEGAFKAAGAQYSRCEVRRVVGED